MTRPPSAPIRAPTPTSTLSLLPTKPLPPCPFPPGKGSTVTLLASVLAAAGYRPGVYTSPHLLRLEERIAVGRRAIAPDDLAFLLTHNAAAVRRVAQAEGGALSHFEVMTALAFRWAWGGGIECYNIHSVVVSWGWEWGVGVCVEERKDGRWAEGKGGRCAGYRVAQVVVFGLRWCLWRRALAARCGGLMGCWVTGNRTGGMSSVSSVVQQRVAGPCPADSVGGIAGTPRRFGGVR